MNRAAETRRDEGTPSSRGNDSVRITDTASRLQSLEARVREASPVDAQRVEQVRQAVTDGTYQVNHERLAERLIAFEFGLDASRPDPGSLT
jgi:negative regulator of flagellin synthesis FlgM